MNTAMKTTFLSDEDLSHVQSILDQHGLSGFDAAIRLWGRGKAIEIKGTLGRRELLCLAEISRFLGDDIDTKATESRGNNVIPMPLATPLSDVPLSPMPQAIAA